jgi:hypothetical protein
MNLRTRLKSGLALLAALAIVLGVATPALADNSDSAASVNVQLNDVGSFTFGLWNSTVTLSATNVTTNQGGTSTSAVVLGVNDTRTNSPGWTLDIVASDFTDGAGHSIPKSNFTMTEPNNANLSCPGTPVPSNPFQVLTAQTGSVNLGTENWVLKATAGRGCGSRIQQLNLSVAVPAGTYATNYTSTLTVSLYVAP